MSKKTPEKTAEVVVTFTEEQIKGFFDAGVCAVIGDPSDDAPTCKDCANVAGGYPKGLFDYCATLVTEKVKAKADKKVVKMGSRVRPKYTDFKDLKKHVTEAPGTSMSMVFNKLLLEGQFTMKQLVDEAGKVQASNFEGKKGGNHFTGIGDIKKHIIWLADRGWVVTFTKKDRRARVTDYKPGEQVKTAFPAVKKEEKKTEAEKEVKQAA